MPHKPTADTDITVHTVKPRDVLKRRTGETTTIHVKAEAPDQDSLIVECWGGHIDKQHRASRLERVDNQTYETTIPFDETGQHTFWIRCRTNNNDLWAWTTTQETPAFTVHVDPAYTYNTTVYNAFVRYFGAKAIKDDGSIHSIEPGTFGDVREHMHRLKTMGVDALYLNPVHQIGELYKNYNPHDALPDYLQPGCPYSVKDYKSIDPELSFGFNDSESHPFDEFRRLVDVAHDHNIRVYMDLVFNHSAHDSVFQRRHPEWFIYKDDPWSLDEPYIHPDEIQDGKPWGDPEHTMSPYDHGHWWKDAAQLNWNNLHELPDEAFDGDNPYKSAPNQPPENPTIDAMYDYFKRIVTFWIKEFGIDGFRCDVAYRVPTDFWEECITEARRAAKQAHPQNGSLDGDVVFIAEDYHVKCEELLEAGFTACFGDYSNRLETVSSLKPYLDYMYDGDDVPDGSQWFIFPECHDFHRNPAKIAKQFRDDHRDADLNANKSRWTLTATLPGIPMIFNGFEKLEWEPASLFSYSKIDWENDKDISDHIKHINTIRKQNPCLQRGDYTYLPTTSGVDKTDVFSFARTYKSTTILVAVNMNVNDTAAATIHLDGLNDFSEDTTMNLRDLQTQETYERSGAELYVELPPGEAHIFKRTD